MDPLFINSMCSSSACVRPLSMFTINRQFTKSNVAFYEWGETDNIQMKSASHGTRCLHSTVKKPVTLRCGNCSWNKTVMSTLRANGRNEKCCATNGWNVHNYTLRWSHSVDLTDWHAYILSSNVKLISGRFFFVGKLFIFKIRMSVWNLFRFI